MREGNVNSRIQSPSPFARKPFDGVDAMMLQLQSAGAVSGGDVYGIEKICFPIEIFLRSGAKKGRMAGHKGSFRTS